MRLAEMSPAWRILWLDQPVDELPVASWPAGNRVGLTSPTCRYPTARPTRAGSMEGDRSGVSEA